MFLSNYAVSANKKSRFIKEQETIEILSTLGIRTGLDKSTLVGPILF